MFFIIVDNLLFRLALFSVLLLIHQSLKDAPPASQIVNLFIILFDHSLDRFWIGTFALKTRLAFTFRSMFLAARCSDLLAFLLFVYGALSPKFVNYMIKIINGLYYSRMA